MELAYTPMAGFLNGEAEEEAMEDDDYADIRKRLFGSLEKPSGRESSTEAGCPRKQPVVVYLRVRPKNQLEVLHRDPECLHQLNENEVLSMAPRTSQTYRNKAGARCQSEGNQKFFFTKVFKPTTDQKELFDEALMPTLRDFFDGQNCLVFTYGVTNSGKTYTVTGTSTEPGILPRSLDVIFNTVDQKQLRNVGFKPKHFSSLAYLTKREQEREEKEKEAILDRARELYTPSLSAPPPPPGINETDASATISEADISVVSKASTNCSKMTEEGMSLDEIQVHDESAIELDSSNENFQFSVWVSFAEIYNEFIYDLLSEAPKKGKARPALKLADDRNRNQFIKGLREVRVGSVEEAIWLLRLGLRHRHVAATRLNYQSSRSHSIYTIKLVRVCRSSTDKPKNALINRISIVDLAGAERSGKTGATGVRVREAGNINNSLLTLGKCIDAMRFNQTRKSSDERIVPFRESKLTRLFQNYFVGKGNGNGVRQGRITMFVNVSNVASVFDETVHVLKFSALARKVYPIVKEVPWRYQTTPHPSRPALPPPQPQEPVAGDGARKSIVWETQEQGVSGEEGELKAAVPAGECTTCARCKVLQSELARSAQARAKVCELEVKLLEQEYTIRQEVCREFNEQLIEIEEKHSRELEEQAEDLQDMYDQRVQLLHQSMKKQFNGRKRRRPNDEEDGGEDSCEQQRLRVELANLQERLGDTEQELDMERNRASAELQDALQTYETRTVMLNKQLADLGLKVSALEKREHELGAQRDALKDQLGQATEEAGMLRSQSKALDDEKSSAEAMVGDLKSECESLRQSRTESEAEVRCLREQLELATSRISQLVRENDGLDTLQESDSLRTQLRSAESQLEELSRTESLLQSQCESLKSEVDLTTRRVAELASQNADLEDEKDTLLQKYQEAQESLAGYTQTVTRIAEKESELATMSARRQELSNDMDALKAQVAELEAQNEILQREKVSFDEREELLKAERSDAQAEVDILQSMISELTKERGAVEEDKRALEVCVGELHQQMSSENAVVEEKDSELASMRDALQKKDEQLTILRAQSEELQSTNGTLSSELCGMKRTLEETLREYENTLKKQSTRIQELEGENEMLNSHNEELRYSVEGTEAKLGVVLATKEGLSSRIDELTQALEASRRTLSQRESELVESSDQCKAVLEEQIAHLRKHSATTDNELCNSREQIKTLQQQLREKESELLSVARETSGEKAAIQSLTSRLEEAGQREKDLQDRITAIEGHHQLESAQLSIKLRELTSELEARAGEAEASSKELESCHQEELEVVKSQWSREVEDLNRQLKQLEKKTTKLKTLEQDNKTLKRTNSDLRKEADGERKERDKLHEELRAQISTLQAQLEAASTGEVEIRSESEREDVGAFGGGRRLPEEPIYDEPPELPDDCNIYETIPGDVSMDTVAATDQEGVRLAAASVLQSIENTMRTSDDDPVDLDRSKPFIANLDYSSQLMEDTFSCHEERTEIDATPRAAKRRGGRAKKKEAEPKKSQKRRKGKRSVEMRDTTDQEDSEETTPLKRSKYTLRDRSKHQRFEEVENLTKATSLKKVTMHYLTSASRSATSFLRDKVEHPPSSPSTDTGSSPTTTIPVKSTRSRRRVRKSQISGPLELLNSPAPTRCTTESKTKVLLGRHLRPARK